MESDSLGTRRGASWSEPIIAAGNNGFEQCPEMSVGGSVVVIANVEYSCADGVDTVIQFGSFSIV